MDKILIVDDEKDIISFLRMYFRQEGYDVITAHSGEEAIRCIQQQPDLILMDINMPGLNGLETCKSIRNKVQCPIIFLTARVQDSDVIEGLASGGDDYLVKPFNIDVLGAKVASHLRREKREDTQQYQRQFGEIIIQYDTRQVMIREETIRFTKVEFDIISLLSSHPGQVFDRERIYERVWGFEAEGDSIAVTEYVKRIRNKFQRSAAASPVETVWGVGYRWK